MVFLVLHLTLKHQQKMTESLKKSLITLILLEKANMVLKSKFQEMIMLSIRKYGLDTLMMMVLDSKKRLTLMIMEKLN